MSTTEQEFEAVFRGLQSGLPRIGFIHEADGTVVSAVLSIVEIDRDGCIRSHTRVAELNIPVVGMPLAA